MYKNSVFFRNFHALFRKYCYAFAIIRLNIISGYFLFLWINTNRRSKPENSKNPDLCTNTN